MTAFWNLPAPARFLRRVIEDLREGNNVVVALPDHAPQGWSTALRAALSRNNSVAKAVTVGEPLMGHAKLINSHTGSGSPNSDRLH